MKKNHKKFSLMFLGLCVTTNFSTKLFADESHNDTRGQLHGKIVAPANTNFSSIVIQVLGANQSDQFQYFSTPNENGEFNFDGLLPGGSTVQLYVWDTSGILHGTVVSAYVTSTHKKEVGVYEITMQEVQYTQSVANIYNTNHDLTNTGICGFVGRYHSVNDPGIKISAYDRYAKYKGPLFEQHVDAKDQFCFFNLSSPSGTDMYDIVIAGPDGENKTFTFYLPPSTFVHNTFLDTSASLYRPITPYFWKETDLYQKKGQWQKLNSVNLATSDDYSFVSYDAAQEDENLFYFPLSNELLEVNYFLTGENENHFFLLLPRTKLFRDTKLARVNDPVENIYVDYDHPFPIKFVTESELVKLNSNYYFQTWNERFGSAFINLDLSQFGIQSTNEVQLSLRNVSGQDVSSFNEIYTSENNRLLGFFFNLLPGRYQIFLKNWKNELLWTYEVRSYPNRVQVLANDLDQQNMDSLKPQHYPKALEYSRIETEIVKNKNESVHDNSSKNLNYFETFETNEEFHSLQEEKVLLQNNVIYQNDANIFCKKQNSLSFLENLSAMRSN